MQTIPTELSGWFCFSEYANKTCFVKLMRKNNTPAQPSAELVFAFALQGSLPWDHERSE
jgi:hypothetical protein